MICFSCTAVCTQRTCTCKCRDSPKHRREAFPFARGAVQKYQCRECANKSQASACSRSKREDVLTYPKCSISPKNRATTFFVVERDPTRCCPWNSIENLVEWPSLCNLAVPSVRFGEGSTRCNVQRKRHTRLKASALRSFGFETSHASFFAASCGSGRSCAMYTRRIAMLWY